MSIYKLLIIPTNADMKVVVIRSDKMSAEVFTSAVELHIRTVCDSHDEEEIQEILSAVWNSNEVNKDVHMVRTEAETILMVEVWH